MHDDEFGDTGTDDIDDIDDEGNADIGNAAVSDDVDDMAGNRVEGGSARAVLDYIARSLAGEPDAIVDIDNDKALKWLRQGAQATERVEKLLRTSGAWDEFRPGSK